MQRVTQLVPPHPGEEISFSQAATAWNMSEGSSALPQTVAALHQYGLLVEHGWGDSRRIALSDLAISIIINPDQDPPARAAAVKEAALNPKIFAELWDALQRGHRDRATLIRLLTTEREARGRASFTRKGADDVLRLFGETLTWAGHETDDARTEPLEFNFGAPSFLSEPRRPIGGDLHLIAPSSRSATRASPSNGWTEEPLTDEVGEPILIRYRGKPSRKRYEFIRDYLDLKIKRLERED